ncbi:MAG: amidohydrolase family protein [Thermodesulfobacteriota bacterium]
MVSEDGRGLLAFPLEGLDDEEGQSVPEGIDFVVDAHVHIFPDRIFDSIHKWFDQHAWPIRYRFTAASLLEFLLSRGISHIIALHYAHKPGIARELNAFVAEVCGRFDRVTGMATVYPGEPNAGEILREGFEAGLGGVKLHSHVQCFSMNSPEMEEVYQACIAHDKPLIMHVGREPKSPAYPCDPYRFCNAGDLERVVRDHPDLRVCVPHLGTDEFSAYQRLIRTYDNLWLDTAMVLTDYLPQNPPPPPLSEWRIDRIMYGTDFPQIPYAWDRELKILAAAPGLTPEELAKISGRNAVEFFGLESFLPQSHPA